MIMCQTNFENSREKKSEAFEVCYSNNVILVIKYMLCSLCKSYFDMSKFFPYNWVSLNSAIYDVHVYINTQICKCAPSM